MSEQKAENEADIDGGSMRLSPSLIATKPAKPLFFARKAFQSRRSETDYDEYLMAMKRVHYGHSDKLESPVEILSPRARYRKQESEKRESNDEKVVHSSVQETTCIGVIASMVPDEIIYKYQDYSIRTYETALMFIDITGFTNLCERYTTSSGRGGPSKLTQVLNSYIGAMVQEILTHNGDVLKFSGDAFLIMWKRTPKLTMQDVVHNAIDCGLIIQKNYGLFRTDVDVVLKVKVAISAGRSHFAIIGDENQTQSSFVIVGQPVWDVKMAQYMTTPGDVLTSASAWMYVNESEYCTQPCGDGRHTRVLGVGASWKRVEKLTINEIKESESSRQGKGWTPTTQSELQYKEFSLRPALLAALRSDWWPSLRRFMPTPVLLAVDNDEPMDFLTEVRHVVVVFLNIITRTGTTDVLLKVVDDTYKYVLSVTSKADGYVNKVSMFDKDMMFLIVFGLRGLKHEMEAQNAILCAFELSENLVDENILSVSIGVTSGITYCGVVGHVLRREYTVIGPAVNKAARLMIAYYDMVSCDKETFLRSKLPQEFFRQLEAKPLKGIVKPGPVYQFSKVGWPERFPGWRHPILDRNDELKQFKAVLQNALEQQQRSFTRYRDHKYAVAYTGRKAVGTTRLLEESLSLVPDSVRKRKMILKESGIMSYSFIRSIISKKFKRTITADVNQTRNLREKNEAMIRHCINTMETTPLQLYALNIIFDCRFPLPENFRPSGDILTDLSVKSTIREICIKNFVNLWVLGIDNAQFIDDDSWRILIILLDTKMIFIIMAISNVESISTIAQTCLTNHMVVNIPLRGISRSYLAALACQLLDVQAIPADLEKVMESASGGLPGWIQNFVISLVQREELSIVMLTRFEAQKLGAVMPSPVMLQVKSTSQHTDDYSMKGNSELSMCSHSVSILSSSKQDELERHDQEMIQMAVLPESYTFDNMNVDITMDALILKIYDSLNPFEKMLLKCGSVLGDVFTRRMLLHLLQSNSPKKFAEAVAKLFSIRVLECEGGDFTRDTSLVLVHPAPSEADPKPPYCACLGTRRPASCRHLPMYAFCGYMKFRHTLFRTTTYELLTENQKHDLHSRALLYLERYTRRCLSCGAGCFGKLLGLRCDSGLVDEREALKRTRRQICALSAEAKMIGEEDTNSEYSLPGDMSYQLLETEGTLMSRIIGKRDSGFYPKTVKGVQEQKRVRSFSSLDLENCECLSILQHVYSQVIDHCKGAGENQKLFEAYMEYADLCININVNIPQCVRLLSELEGYIKSKTFCLDYKSPNNWVHDFNLASVLSLRGVCMLEAGDLIEARKELLRAMELYRVPFPTSGYWRKIHNFGQSLKQLLALYVAPNFYIARYSGTVGHFYDDIATTLSRLYVLFTECKEEANATLAAKWSLNFALRSNSNLRVLCTSYANMISVYTQKQKYSMCITLEKRSLENCRRKRGQLDVTEVDSVCLLYTNIFLFYVEWSKKLESLEFGLVVMHMMPGVHSSQMRQVLILSMLKLLLCDLRIVDMVTIMTEFLYLSDTTDLCSETWYFYYCLVILLDTGYCVESLCACERFYMKKVDSLLRSKTVEASWNFYVAMWLMIIRIGAWERSILWEEKIQQLLCKKFEKNEFNAMMLARLIEGLLITLVKQMDNRNIKKILVLQKALKVLFQELNKSCEHASLYRPKYYLLVAYHHYITGNKHKAFNFLNKARDYAKQYSLNIELIWIEHTRNYWKGSLNPNLRDYWCEHVEPGNLLDYRDFDVHKPNAIVPFTLPVPKDLEKIMPMATSHT
ncbi:unnamed protein product [Arctia plantaginis]|uniref:Guanylate cyclase domain-containing protein n=1 Tax=Arctia plantaginis TaxID=874455 RepID=A0A8S0ZK86_ARCPL|nr:unnamed protein product [Arctia plantaginis]